VLAEVDTVAKLPEFAGIQLFVMHDQAEGVTSSLAELGEAGLLGTALSVLVLFFFLRHWPSTLMVSLAIPICFVMTLGMMYFLGISLNILSMMGLLLGVGMLVDNAVVVVESIYQKREKYPDNPWLAAIEGTRSVQISISAGTLTSVIVFLPNIFGERNFIAIYLSQVAFTITISLLCSWHLFALFVAGGCQSDSDAVGTHENTRRVLAQHRTGARHAGPLCADSCLDAGASAQDLGLAGIGDWGQLFPRVTDQRGYVSVRRNT